MTFDRRTYWTGIGLTALGALIISPDALLFRLLESDLWTAAFWRMFLMGLSIGIALIVFRRRMLLADIRAVGWAMAPAAIFLSLSNLGFVYAISHTSAAETLTIIATAPVFTAIFAMILGEKPPMRTWVAAAAIALGIGIIFDADTSAESLAGNIAAGVCAISIAIFFTIARAKRDCDLTSSLMVSAFITAAICASLATTLEAPSGDWPILLLLGLLVLPVALTLITIGPRRLPAAEVGLLMLIETALGPMWVWLALGEEPSEAALLGGALIIGALTIHSFAAWRAQKTVTAA